MPKDMGIYKITNLINGKFYIGSSIHLRRRKWEHKSKLKNNTHVNPIIQSSFNKYGIENFKFEVIEWVDDKSILLKREQFWIDSTKAYDGNIGFNINLLATGGGLYGEKNAMYGISPKARMDEATYERWLKARQGENASKPMYGKRHTLETRKRISAARIGKYHHSEEWKKQHSERLKGHKVSDAQKKKMSDFMQNNPTPNDKGVVCVDTGVIYKSISEASREMEVTKQAISNVLRGKSKTCKGLKWSYYDKLIDLEG